MVTLRASFSPAEAALAKTLLDDHGIVSALADENSYLYGGAAPGEKEELRRKN